MIFNIKSWLACNGFILLSGVTSISVLYWVNAFELYLPTYRFILVYTNNCAFSSRSNCSSYYSASEVTLNSCSWSYSTFKDFYENFSRWIPSCCHVKAHLTALSHSSGANNGWISIFWLFTGLHEFVVGLCQWLIFLVALVTQLIGLATSSGLFP